MTAPAAGWKAIRRKAEKCPGQGPPEERGGSRGWPRDPLGADRSLAFLLRDSVINLAAWSFLSGGGSIGGGGLFCCDFFLGGVGFFCVVGLGVEFGFIHTVSGAQC